MAYVELLEDQRKPMVSAFLSRTVAWFNSTAVEFRRVMSNNGTTDASKGLAKACLTLDRFPGSTARFQRRSGPPWVRAGPGRARSQRRHAGAAFRPDQQPRQGGRGPAQ